MQSISKLLAFGIISIALTACVTTREQLNQEKKGVGPQATTDNGAPTRGNIKSVDLTPKKPARAAMASHAPARLLQLRQWRVTMQLQILHDCPATAPVTAPAQTAPADAAPVVTGCAADVKEQ